VNGRVPADWGARICGRVELDRLLLLSALLGIAPDPEAYNVSLDDTEAVLRQLSRLFTRSCSPIVSSCTYGSPIAVELEQSRPNDSEVICDRSKSGDSLI